MPKIDTSDSNVFDMPSGSFIRNKCYVYINTTNTYVPAKDGKKGYSDHDSVCIGKIKDKQNKKFYANQTYYRMFLNDNLPEAPALNDSLGVGASVMVEHAARKSVLFDILNQTFGYETTCKIIDLATYMLVEESAVFQHFPKYAREHAGLLNIPFDDTQISRFLKNELTVSKINQFKELWAKSNISDGRVFFCYDSTNENSDAQGVSLVEKGHAKDDPTRAQVNTDYVVRQEDGLPITYNNFPGSIVDVKEAPEMIQYISDIAGEKAPQITMIADRGYISEDNIDDMDTAGVNFLLLLKGNMNDSKELLDQYGSQIKSMRNMMDDKEHFGMRVKKQLFHKGEERYFYLIWDEQLEKRHRDQLIARIESKENQLTKAINRHTKYTRNELKNRFEEWFELSIEECEKIKVKSKGRGKKGVMKEEESYKIVSYKRKEEILDKALNNCGIKILVSSKELSVKEAYEGYSKRDCIEKVFRALKSSLGMDVIGVRSEDHMQGKSLIWFSASIIRSVIAKSIEPLKEESKKYYTIPSVMDIMDSIKIDRNINTGKYEQRYQLTSKQKKIMDALGIEYTKIKEKIDSLTY